MTSDPLARRGVQAVLPFYVKACPDRSIGNKRGNQSATDIPIFSIKQDLQKYCYAQPIRYF
ncbi:MAG: hypothetical protein IPJ31_11750 [Bacteroidetes bacterium]|nr:hypothetical protein [Bacteroidota bacterium]MBP6315467.1 hypothetical protein [Chitinophagaceae bacterium]